MSGPAQLKVLAICGSLRRGSFNAGLIQEIVDEAPSSLRVEVFEGLGELPLINNDLVVDNVPPTEILEVGARIRAADAVVIACPEYCYGIPAPLKNLLDWMSFPPPVNPLRFKPVGILGASIGHHGTLRAQLALRQSLLFHDALVMSKPEVYVTGAAKKFVDGRLVDENTKKLIPLFLENVEEFTRATLARQLDPATREFQFT